MDPGPDSEASHARRSARVGLQTAVIDNSAAFGFSITITSSYGALNQLARAPTLLDIAGFALCAVVAFAVLQALTTHGFRRHAGAAPRSVVLLGTALDIVSVGLGLGAAMLAAFVLPAGVAWPVGGFLASLVFALSQALELMLAARLERLRGDPEAERTQG
ncbi:MAG: hypothetical protein IJH84_08610 [Saccharopolyspora sp.]|uniref:hypothetical protein n=1 Tax=unclassified Saccharopolyspora TaxID=2646250 RepID=UPI0025FB1F51|nr:hypothetical protein [Saccharopolyspora sp.]MBQ6641082.1 hypothetical protein [Saccharopolyspora sp.]